MAERDRVELSRRPRSLFRICLLVAAGLTLLFGTSAAQASAPGTVVAWGCAPGTDYGQCSVPSARASVVGIAAGGWHSLAVRADGTVVASGCVLDTDYGQCSVPNGLSGVIAVAAGGTHSLALKNDGTVVAWGCVRTDHGQCSVPNGLAGVTAIAAGATHSLALKSDGTVVAWGCGLGYDFGQCTVPPGLSGVTAIAAGETHSLALKSDGTVVAWGCLGTSSGECSVPSGLSGVTAIAASSDFSLALKADGTVVAWGCGSGTDFGQCNVPSGLSGVVAIAAGYADGLALRSDGTVVAWGCGGMYDVGQCSVPNGLFGVTAIAAGPWHSLALVVPTNQTITFGPLASKSYGDADFGISASASSGLPVSFSASGTCTVSGAVAHISGAGSCSVTASQPGNLNYNPAPDVSQTFAIAKASQTIAFGPLANKTYGSPDFRLTAPASSGLAVSFAVSGKCTVSGAWVHLTGVGTCTATASQPGDANFNPAPPVSRSFSIKRPRCTVPNVVGEPLKRAKQTIVRRHCRTGKIRYAYSKRKKGIILSQKPRPGRVLPAGTKIKLIVSRGRGH